MRHNLWRSKFLERERAFQSFVFCVILDATLDVILDGFSNTGVRVVFSKSHMTYYYPNLRYRINYHYNGETFKREIVVGRLGG